MKFLFMDETYPDNTLPAQGRAVSLTGVLVPARAHPEIRTRYYQLICDAVGREPGVVPPLPEIHASKLLLGSADEKKFAFLEGLVEIVRDFDLAVYRVGYVKSKDLVAVVPQDRAILGLCFAGFLHLLEQELQEGVIWPVMETDRTDAQDQAFQGHLQQADYVEAQLGPGFISRDAANLGEVLYSTKRSTHGAIVDCVAYLLQVRSVNSLGQPLTAFKKRLLQIATGLSPSVRFDEIINMTFGPPPLDYLGSGPYRYMYDIPGPDAGSV